MRKLCTLLVSVGLALTSLVSTAPAGAAASPPPTTPTRSAAAWLAHRVNAQGFVANPDGGPNLGSTSQTAAALSATGLYRGTVDAVETWLSANAGTVAGPSGSKDPGTLANLILGAVASGRDPRSFGGYDLVAVLRSTERTTGPDAGLFGATDPTYDGAFRQGLSLWALHVAGEPADTAATGWLQGQQCADGGWTPYRADTGQPCPAADSPNYDGPDTNSTALALLGLRGQGVTPTADAVAYLGSVRTASGGWAFRALASDAPDANSTGLVLQSLLATNGPDQAGLRALLGFQVGCGSSIADDRGGVAFQPSNGSLVPDVMATIQALPAIAGRTMGQTPDPNSYEAPAACTGAPSPNQRFVEAAYQTFRSRQPTGQELGVAGALDSGAVSRHDVTALLARTVEHVSTYVRRFYTDTLGRQPDQAGLDYWVRQITGGQQGVAQVGAFFYASSEYYNNRAGGTDPSWVSDLYDKILHRGPDQGGLQYWVGQTATAGRPSVALRFYQSAESRRYRTQLLFATLLGRFADAGGLGYWSDRLLVVGDLDVAADLTTSSEFFDRAQAQYP